MMLKIQQSSRNFLIKSSLHFQDPSRQLSLAVLGAEFDKGQPRGGTARGPDAIRATNLFSSLRQLGHTLQDVGNISETKDITHNQVPQENRKLKNWPDVSAFNRLVSDNIRRLSSSGHKVITLGGDHSIGMGTVHGHLSANPEACVLWVDAHADINTMDTTPSGNIHGMPLSFVIKELQDGNSKLPELAWLKSRISARNVAFVGLRDVDPAERKIIYDLGITALSTEDVDHMGMREAVRYALSRTDPESRRPIHVSFDIDALDPMEAPSTGTAVRGGLTLREGSTLLETIHRTGRLSAFDLVEVNPAIGSPEDVLRTTAAAKLLILAAFGNNRAKSLKRKSSS